MATLEGPVPYEPGDALVTGIEGERWPVARALFLEHYEPVAPTAAGDDGRYVRQPEELYAVQLAPDDMPVVVRTASGGELDGTAGDWLVRYGPGDVGIVRQDIFSKTYVVLGGSR